MNEANERRLVCSVAEVRAIFGGATELRRPVNPQPLGPQEARTVASGFVDQPPGQPARWFDSPYGRPGDRLWVAETHAYVDRLFSGYDREDPTHVAYRADLTVREHAADGSAKMDTNALNWDLVRWRPSTAMVRWVSRLTLEVAAVRIEQDGARWVWVVTHSRVETAEQRGAA